MNCPNCGTELRKGANYCLCGQRIGAPPASGTLSGTREPIRNASGTLSGTREPIRNASGSAPMGRDHRSALDAPRVIGSVNDPPSGLAPREAATRTTSRTTPAAQADRPAEVWRRLLAKVIDSSVLALLLAIGFQALGEERALDYLSMFAQVESVEEINFNNAALPTVALTFISFWLPLWILSAACIAVFAGTPGKLLMGFKQVRTDGRKLDFRHALLREVLVYVIGLGFGLPIWGILTLIASRAYFIYFGVTPWDHLLGVRLVRT